MRARFYIAWTLRVLLGICFVWAAGSKLRDPLGFAAAVESYRVVGSELSRWVALGLPWLELWAGIGLALPWLRWGSNWILGVLLLGFMGLHASAWMRGLNVDCGCFGFSESAANYAFLLIRNGMLLLGIVVLICMEMDAWTNERREG
ncbi:MAG: hypothetical protein GWO81_00040 [Verrucomicrobia bacterium]|nr:hypothetical protein [Verrucomicrobiota bacterium]